jgi:ABC-type sugar transport system substrate-binding protein
VTRKTKVQVTLDNGERYGKYLRLVGEAYGHTYIVPWDGDIDERLAEARSDALNKRIINGLQGIVWSTVSNETRRRAAKALLDAGVPVGYVLEGDLT